MIEKQKLITVENPFEKNEMTQDSEFNGDEMIKEFNRKLHSVQQLNQQHQCLIQNLNTKFGDLQGAGNKNNSGNEVKVLTSKEFLGIIRVFIPFLVPDKKQERKEERKEVRKAISDLKQEVTTALQQIQTFQSEDGTIIYEPNSGSGSGSGTQESKQKQPAKTNEKMKVQNPFVKPEVQEMTPKPQRLVYKGGSAASLVSTSDNEGTPTKSG